MNDIHFAERKKKTINPDSVSSNTINSVVKKKIKISPKKDQENLLLSNLCLVRNIYHSSFKNFKVYLFLRYRERERGRGDEQRERETENPQQAAHPAQSPTQGSILPPLDHDLSWNQTSDA